MGFKHDMYWSAGIMGTALFLAFLSQNSHAQALPSTTYTPPASKIGGAMASSIQQTLIRRGFAANDPRIVQTIQAVGARVPTLVSAAGTGAKWLSLAGRLSPWVTAGVLIYEGVSWYFDNNGNIVAKTGGGAFASPGTAAGNSCYRIVDYTPIICAGSPEEAYVSVLMRTTIYNGFTKIDLTPDAVGSTAYNNGRRYIANGTGIRSDNGASGALPGRSIYIGTANGTCPTGQAWQDGVGCVPSYAEKYVPGATQSPAQTWQVSYDAIPQAQKELALSPDMVAELANRHWRDAAAQPDYPGVPWSATDPVSKLDPLPFKNAHPTDWPKISALNEPVPTTSTPPITLPETNPNETQTPGEKIDLGPDPGIQAPELEEPPTELFKPIKDAMQPWMSWQVPAHNAVCPTWSAAPEIGGQSFAIDISSHCDIAEQYRALIQAACMAAYAVIAVFIILSA